MSSNKRARVSELASSPAELADSQKQVKTPFQKVDAASAGEQHPVPELGLSLAALRAFCAAYGGRDVRCVDEHKVESTLPFEQLSTAQVCFNVVMPATLSAGRGGEPCTYAELLLARPSEPPLAAHATHFVSHAWSYAFVDLVAALESLNGAESAYFWLDIFVGACRSCQSHSAR